MSHSVLKKLEQKRGKLTGLYYSLRDYPELLEKFSDLGGYLRFEGKLPFLVKKWVILWVAKKLEYPRVWNTHLFEVQLPLDLLSVLEKGEIAKIDPYQSLQILVNTVLDKKGLDIDIQEKMESLYGSQGFLELVLLTSFYESFISCSIALNIP